MPKIFQIIKLCFAITGTVSCVGQNKTEPRSIIVYKTNEPIKVDGLANEKSWGESEVSNDFIDIEGAKTPTYKTNVRMLWDETYLYFFAELEEPHVWATLKQRDTVIFYNNDFEIFIDPDGDTHNYYEFEMNALNTVWDLFLVKPYRESAPIVDSWEILGLKSAVHINGTLNNPSDEDKGWSVEVAMPWAVLKEASGSNAIPEGDYWRINFSRVNWDFDLSDGKYSRKKDANGTFLPEYNWVWSPQGVVNMHEPEHWGYAYFSPKIAGDKDSFKIPNDEQIRWLLYQLYREQKKYFAQNKSWATSIKELGLEPVLEDGTKVNLDLELHRMGWTIQVESPFTGSVYVIGQDGKYQQIK